MKMGSANGMFNKGGAVGRIPGGSVGNSMRHKETHGNPGRNTFGGVAKPSSGSPKPKRKAKNSKGIGRMMTSGY